MARSPDNTVIVRTLFRVSVHSKLELPLSRTATLAHLRLNKDLNLGPHD